MRRIFVEFAEAAARLGRARDGNIAVLFGFELEGVNLIINADYAASDVPVPPGLGPKSTSVRLSE